MPRNVINPRHLEPGARWDFITASGKRVEYALEREIARATDSGDSKIPGLSAMYALTNRETGREAMVTEKWMREGQLGDRGAYWESIAEAPSLEVAA